MDIRQLVLLALPFVLLLSACSNPPSPEEAVDWYLSETGKQDTETAIQQWELSEVGTEFFDLGPEQQKIRMDGRRALAIKLTEALAIPGSRLGWEQEGATYYATGDGVPRAIDDAGEAQLATIEIRLIIEGSGDAALEERLAFNLWKKPEEGWRITGVDKGLLMMRPFLDKVREYE